MIVLAVGNVRLVLENYARYGVLVRLSAFDIRRRDVCLAALLTALIPAHLFIAYVIESAASLQIMAQARGERRPPRKQLWSMIKLLHSVNAGFCLTFATVVVYYCIHQPLIGTFCEIHAVVVCLKTASYALTNRDLRDGVLHSKPGPRLYAPAAYPHNLTLSNLSYFWWAPTLVYQPVYPRSPAFRPVFFVKRLLEIVGLSVLIWLLSAQYAVPILDHSLVHFHAMDVAGIVERLFKLASVSMVIWLAGFFLFFQSALNALAEVMRFGDRQFYDDWWNATSVGAYWKLWNKPVTNYFRRHIYVPLVRRGWNATAASVMVFFVSGVLHELCVGVPTHNIIGAAFASMILQIPLVLATAPLERLKERMPAAGVFGNCVFWASFFLGQPLGALLYFFAWNVKQGHVPPA
ncbi:MBOAT, membrane-bound O-acyltransferase family-domain-containing protein [Dipodascopsis tothii]|uniref:MBOAT, membrane-bound O-acyltransferase family-domain-containing protein n=1 Tax=Dipodascopsis tothii TaxID=44089 RepID=UPI0034CF28F5